MNQLEIFLKAKIIQKTFLIMYFVDPEKTSTTHMSASVATSGFICRHI